MAQGFVLRRRRGVEINCQTQLGSQNSVPDTTNFNHRSISTQKPKHSRSTSTPKDKNSTTKQVKFIYFSSLDLFLCKGLPVSVSPPPPQLQPESEKNATTVATPTELISP
ncbi:unnamed protein product [Brassica oleracea]